MKRKYKRSSQGSAYSFLNDFHYHSSVNTAYRTRKQRLKKNSNEEPNNSRCNAESNKNARLQGEEARVTSEEAYPGIRPSLSDSTQPNLLLYAAVHPPPRLLAALQRLKALA
jgi:hypothetical protein